ncbi:MAG: EpsI family protein [Gemmatimonadetes bacterium]|nr:EpsI family protein [Gemmatimonadota bacterium]
MTAGLRWAPAGILSIGALLTVGITGQRALPLRAPLETAVPRVVEGFRGQDIPIDEAEQRVAGMSSYVLRVYTPVGATVDVARSTFSVYVGYYERQMQGRTIHSPKNCLPGAGWQALVSRIVTIDAPGGPVPVNEYLIQNGDARALVLYWYQGRGRIQANEYRVKWDLLRDSALRHRSDEALVRIVVPVTGSEAEAMALARRVARDVIPGVYAALPA